MHHTPTPDRLCVRRRRDPPGDGAARRTSDGISRSWHHRDRYAYFADFMPGRSWPAENLDDIVSPQYLVSSACPDRRAGARRFILFNLSARPRVHRRGEVLSTRVSSNRKRPTAGAHRHPRSFRWDVSVGVANRALGRCVSMLKRAGRSGFRRDPLGGGIGAVISPPSRPRRLPHGEIPDQYSPSWSWRRAAIPFYSGFC